MMVKDKLHYEAQHKLRRATSMLLLGVALIALTPRRAEASAGTAAVIVSGAVAIAGLVVFVITRDKDVLEQTSPEEDAASVIRRRVALRARRSRAGLPAVKASAQSPTLFGLAAATKLVDTGPGIALKGGRLMGQVVRDDSGRVDGYVARYAIEF